MRIELICYTIPLLLLAFGCGKEKPFSGSAVTQEQRQVAATNPPAGMCALTGGTFMMGSNDTNFRDEQPLHAVTVSPFYIDTTEVTQADFLALRGFNPSYHTGDPRFPVERVTWYDAALYCNARSLRDGLDTVYRYTRIDGAPRSTCYGLVDLKIDLKKNGYRLPTEAEWEYACRAGSTADFYWGADYPLASLQDTAILNNHTAWAKNSEASWPVASRIPNAWGLYDMSGNVREWCNDIYDSSYYAISASQDPVGALHGENHVLRGGSWFFGVQFARSAHRSRNAPDLRDLNLGFRCVRPRR